MKSEKIDTHSTHSEEVCDPLLVRDPPVEKHCTVLYYTMLNFTRLYHNRWLLYYPLCHPVLYCTGLDCVGVVGRTAGGEGVKIRGDDEVNPGVRTLPPQVLGQVPAQVFTCSSPDLDTTTAPERQHSPPFISKWSLKLPVTHTNAHTQTHRHTHTHTHTPERSHTHITIHTHTRTPSLSWPASHSVAITIHLNLAVTWILIQLVNPLSPSLCVCEWVIEWGCVYVWVCMCECVCVSGWWCTRVYMYACIYLCVWVYLYVCIYMYTCIKEWVNTWVHEGGVYACVSVCGCMCVYMCACACVWRTHTARNRTCQGRPSDVMTLNALWSRAHV